MRYTLRSNTGCRGRPGRPRRTWFGPLRTQAWRPVAWAMACIAASLIMTSPSAQVLRFSGYDWIVKAGRNLGPGPNHWDKNNVFVDSQGYLHLKLSRKAGEWFSAEVTSVQRFGFGRYEFV